MPYVFRVDSNRHKTENDFLAAYSVPTAARTSRADVNVEMISLAKYSNLSTTKAMLFLFTSSATIEISEYFGDGTFTLFAFTGTKQELDNYRVFTFAR